MQFDIPYVGLTTERMKPLPVDKYWERMRRDTTKVDPQYVIAYHFMKLATLTAGELSDVEKVDRIAEVVENILDPEECNLFRTEERQKLPLNYTLSNYQEFLNSPPHVKLMDRWAALKAVHTYDAIRPRLEANFSNLINRVAEGQEAADLTSLKQRLEQSYHEMLDKNSLIHDVMKFKTHLTAYAQTVNRLLREKNLDEVADGFDRTMQAAISEIKGEDDPVFCLKSLVCGLPVVAIMRTSDEHSVDGVNHYGYIVDVKEPDQRTDPPNGVFDQNLTYDDRNPRIRPWVPRSGLTKAGAVQFTDVGVNGLNAIVVFKEGSYFEMPLVHALVLHMSVGNTMGTSIDPGFATMRLAKVARPLSAFLDRDFPGVKPAGGSIMPVDASGAALADCYGTGVPYGVRLASGQPFEYTMENTLRLLNAFRIMRAAGGDLRNGAAPLPADFDSKVAKLRASIMQTLPAGATVEAVQAARNELLAYSDVFGFFVNEYILRPPTRADAEPAKLVMTRSPKLASDLYFAHSRFTGDWPDLVGSEQRPMKPSPYWEPIKKNDELDGATIVEFGGLLIPSGAYNFMKRVRRWVEDASLSEEVRKERIAECFEEVTDFCGSPDDTLSSGGYIWTFSQMVLGFEEGKVYTQVVESAVMQ